MPLHNTKQCNPTVQPGKIDCSWRNVVLFCISTFPFIHCPMQPLWDNQVWMRQKPSQLQCTRYLHISSSGLKSSQIVHIEQQAVHYGLTQQSKQPLCNLRLTPARVWLGLIAPWVPLLTRLFPWTYDAQLQTRRMTPATRIVRSSTDYAGRSYGRRLFWSQGRFLSLMRVGSPFPNYGETKIWKNYNC